MTYRKLNLPKIFKKLNLPDIFKSLIGCFSLRRAVRRHIYSETIKDVPLSLKSKRKSLVTELGHDICSFIR